MLRAGRDAHATAARDPTLGLHLDRPVEPDDEAGDRVVAVAALVVAAIASGL